MKSLTLLLILSLLSSCKITEVKENNVVTVERSDDTPHTRAIGGWDRKKDLSDVSENLRKLLIPSAFLKHDGSSGTGLYVGKVGNEHLLLTNAHVIKSDEFKDSEYCRKNLKIILNSAYMRCSRLIKMWKDIDLAMIAIEIAENPYNKPLLEMEPLRFRTDFSKGTLLYNAGYATEEGKYVGLTYNDDKHCRVFSDDNEIKQLPVKSNGVTSNTWSMAIGCDSSPGNSGSGIMDRETGEILGLAWGVGETKENELKNDRFVQHVDVSTDDSIWKMLTYAVPMIKIKEVLETEVDQGLLEDSDEEIIKDFLDLFN